MDDSVRDKLREFEALRTIMKNELDVARAKLEKQRNKALSEIADYETMIKRAKALYDADAKLADRLLRFKLRNGLV